MKKGQNLLEYLLIFAIVAVAAFYFAGNMDLNAIKNYIFVRPPSADNPSQIKIEPMTDK